MKIRSFGREAILIVCFILLFSGLAFAQGKDVVRTVGKVMDLDVSKTVLIVSETSYVWDNNTLFYDEEGSPMTANKLRKDIRVSIEARKIKGKPYLIKKLSLLQK